MTRDTEMMPSIAVAELHGDLGGMESGKANELFTGLLSDISKACGEVGVIGHNKANFKCGEDMLSISCTTEDGNVRSKMLFKDPVGEYTGVMNIIVYGADFSVLRGIIKENSAMLPSGHVRIAEDGRCDDPGCNDPNCNDPNHRFHGSFIKLE